MKLKTFTILSLALFAAAGCSDSPESQPSDDPRQPEIILRQLPDEAEPGGTVEVRAIVTVQSGTISTVTLTYNDGSEKSVGMTPASGADEYSGSFTAPREVGKTVTYYVSATTEENKTAVSETVSLIVVDEGTVTNPTEGLRLSEIGTVGDYKFIEIYNPSGMPASLDGISLWKNGEELVRFGSSLELNGKNYGVYRAKGTTFTIPTSAVDLGSTETGLSGTKSLSVELRYNGEVIDAFANTINPGVAQMTPDDWDGETEHDGTNFIRRAGDTYGWYTTPTTTAATPGAENGTTGATRLKHQLLAQDAVADKPYITNIMINPDQSAMIDPSKVGMGLTPANNVIQFSVYYDVHSTTPSVGSATHLSGVTYEMRPSLTGSASGTQTSVTLSASNSLGSYEETIKVLVFSTGTTFATFVDNIRLNEIQTKSGDAIELYNRSSSPVVIAGMRIRKNKDRIFTVPGYMVMAPGSYAVLGCNGKDLSSNMVGDASSALYLGAVPNGLSGSKSLLVELRRPKTEGDDENSVNIDAFVNISTSVSSPDKDSDWDTDGFVEHTFETAARKGDGTGDWYVVNFPTLGYTNSSATAGSPFTQSYHQ